MNVTKAIPKRHSRSLLSLLTVVVLTVSCVRQPNELAASETGDFADTVETEFYEPPIVHSTIPQGTKLTIRLLGTVSSRVSAQGDLVEGIVLQDLYQDGRIVIPRGSTVTGTVTDARPLPSVGGHASLAFTFNTLTLPDGNVYPMEARFARARIGFDDTVIILGKILQPGSTVPDGSFFDPPTEFWTAGLAANTPGMEVELPAMTLVRLTMRSPVVVEVERE